MKYSPTTDANISRIINKEILTNELDPQCRALAISESNGFKDKMIERYTIHRTKTLKSFVVIDTSALQNEGYASTEICHKHHSSRCNDNDSKTRAELTSSLLKWELCVGNSILAIGTAGAALACLSLAGSVLQTTHIMVITALVSIMLFIPVFLARMKVLLYQSGLSLLCAVFALASTTSGVLLLKNNPKKETRTVARIVVDEPRITIKISPAFSSSTTTAANENSDIFK